MDLELPHLWRPREYQVGAWNHFFPNASEKRAVITAHRRWGKDLLALNLITCLAHQTMATYWHLFPFFTQGRGVIWNGIDKNNGRAFMDYIPKHLIESTHNNEMRVHFKNGSIYQIVGSDNADRLVGTNPYGIVLSEYSLCDPKTFQLLMPILRENKGWALFISTVRGKNHMYRLGKKAVQWQKDEPTRWYQTNQTINDTKREDGLPVVSMKDVEQDRREGMSEAMIQQEYFNNPDSSLEGAYYGAEMEKALADGRICSVPWEPKLIVETSWDIGVRDSTAICFFQRYGQEIRVIDYYENSGEGLKHYARVLREKEYHYGTHWAPHDIAVREFTSGASRLEAARAMGLKFRVTQQHEIQDGIEQVRNILGRCYFDGSKCERLIDALRGYRKERAADELAFQSEDGIQPIYRDEPLHDWTSHAASAFRYFAWNCKLKAIGDYPRQETAVDDYSYV
jgi:phage terminase large subunit